MANPGPRTIKTYDFENDSKVCRMCNTSKKLKEFYLTTYKQLKYNTGRRYPQNICKACQKARKLSWDKKNPERAKKARLFRRLRKEFNLDFYEYDVMFTKQKGVCAICFGVEPDKRFTPRLCVDHNHTTNRVRGLLCSYCNRGLGQFKDSTTLLLLALKYLRKDARRTNKS